VSTKSAARIALPLVAVGVLLASTTAWSATTSEVLAAVKAATTVNTLPATISPTLSDAVNNNHSTLVAGDNWILNSCDPYWVHAQAAKPVPCVYGATKSKKVVVLFGDSNAGSWAPAFDAIFKQMGYKLDLFGFIGCTTSPVTETSTQPGFPAQYQLCNTWHANLPAAVRAVHPVAVMDAASPWQALTQDEATSWVPQMKWAFDKMTLGRPKTIRVELGTTPLFPSVVAQCLASFPKAIQTCGVDYTDPTSAYAKLLARDKQIATVAKAKLITASQWLCYNHKCPPVIKNFMVVIDRDHTSVPFVKFLQAAIKASFTKHVRLP
jgi:SGNH domain (fused to AT3 domains)